MVRALANPIFLRAAVLLFCAAIAFLLGLLGIRALRRKIDGEAEFSPGPSAAAGGVPLHLYNTVIQELKQQKHALHVQSQEEQHRARMSETLSQAVLANMTSGVLMLGANGLVKTANPAAKEILGFASLTGMSAGDIFRGAAPISSPSRPDIFPDETMDEGVPLAAEVETVLREGSGRRHVEARYKAPSGAERSVSLTISPVPGEDGSLIGVVCLIEDITELERMRRQQELHGELSAEKALQLRTSLATISDWARQLASQRDGTRIMQFAADIAQEAEQLDRKIGGFLCESQAAKSAARGR